MIGWKARKATWLLVSACFLLLAAGSLALAQAPDDPAAPSDPGLDLLWWTVDGGGGTLTGDGGLTLVGTAGQPDAGLLEGGALTLGGGFWRGGEVAGSVYEIYLPIVMR